jgi:dTDP-4-dehydrorhamnose reductase
MRVLVTGKNGQLGRSINKIINERQYNDDFVFVDRHELNYSKVSKILKYFENNFFDVIINCAAYTKVDEAEKEFEIANQINHLSVKKLAEIHEKQKAKIIHISTDYVYDGLNPPFSPTTLTNPLQNYGMSKLLAEHRIRSVFDNEKDYLILRVPVLYSDKLLTLEESAVPLIVKKVMNNVEEFKEDNFSIRRPVFIADFCKFIISTIKNLQKSAMKTGLLIEKLSSLNSSTLFMTFLTIKGTALSSRVNNLSLYNTGTLNIR